MERTNAFVVKWQTRRNGDTFPRCAHQGISMDTKQRSSLICQKKQLTQILDHSLKSVILRPQFLQGKMQKFRQNLSDGISGKIV